MQTDWEKNLRSEIDAVVDGWVSSTLRDRFYHAPVNRKNLSLWDRFKRGVTNWWWGPKGDKYNPHRWQNRFGDELGSPQKVAGDPRSTEEDNNKSESFDPSIFTLSEYAEIRRIVDSVDLRLNESADGKDGFDNLRLMSLLRSAAEDLKVRLFNALKGKMGRAQARPGKPPGGDKRSAPPGTTNIASGKPSGEEADDEAAEAARKEAAEAARKEAEEAEEQAKKKAEELARREAEEAAEAARKAAAANPLEGFFVGEETDFIGKIGDFLFKNEGRKDRSKKYEEKREDLKSWFDKEREKLRKYKAIKNKEERIDAIKQDWREKVLKTGEFIKEIARITGIRAPEVRKDMISYLSSLT